MNLLQLTNLKFFLKDREFRAKKKIYMDVIGKSNDVGCPVWYITQEDGPGWKLEINERLAKICEVPFTPEGCIRPEGWSKPAQCITNLMYDEWR